MRIMHRSSQKHSRVWLTRTKAMPPDRLPDPGWQVTQQKHRPLWHPREDGKLGWVYLIESRGFEAVLNDLGHECQGCPCDRQGNALRCRGDNIGGGRFCRYEGSATTPFSSPKHALGIVAKHFQGWCAKHGGCAWSLMPAKLCCTRYATLEICPNVGSRGLHCFRIIWSSPMHEVDEERLICECGEANLKSEYKWQLAQPVQ